MRHLITFIVSILFLCSCKKDGHSHTLKGILHNNCDEKAPLKNQGIQLFKTKDGHSDVGEVIWRGTTDPNGQFLINYDGYISDDYLILQASNSYDFLTEIPANENLENIVAYAAIKANIQVSLNVINPHSLGDTMNLKYMGSSTFMKIPCPLQSGPVYTVIDYVPLNPMGYNGTGDFVFYTWTPDDGHSYRTNFNMDKYCADTVRVTIDVN